MTGIATKFIIAEKVFLTLIKNGGEDAAILGDAAALPFAYLGAVGADFGDYTAARPDLGFGDDAANSSYFKAWLPLLKLIAGNPADAVMGTPERFGFYRDLKAIRDALTEARRVVDEKDIAGAIALADTVETLQVYFDDMQLLMRDLQRPDENDPATLANGTTLLNTIFAIRGGGPRSKVQPSRGWEPRDTLHGSRTGAFLEKIKELAKQDGASRQWKAYAIGAAVGYAADLCGNAFINAIVGSPYRNHWWRHRWISNHVDAWVYGFYKYGAPAGGDPGTGGAAAIEMKPSGVAEPSYDAWPNVTGANLQDRIGIAGSEPDVEAIMLSLRNGTPMPHHLPDDFIATWISAYSEIYGGDVKAIDSEGLNSGYTFLWLTLWIKTSAGLLPSVADIPNAIDGCGEQPPWAKVDGVAVFDGQVAEPPRPDDDTTSPNILMTVCGAILAIIGGIYFLLGYLAIGIGTFLIGLAVAKDGVEPDWDALSCHLGWIETYYNGLTNAFRDQMTLAGFGHPYTAQLKHDSNTPTSTAGMASPTSAALNTVKRQNIRDDYPASRWASSDFDIDWIRYPSELREAVYPWPTFEASYPKNSGVWPNHFVDGLNHVAGGQAEQTNPLVAADGRPPRVVDQAAFDARRAETIVTGLDLGLFGNAVDVALALIGREDDTRCPDWDLDSDASLGTATWDVPSSGDDRGSATWEGV